MFRSYKMFRSYEYLGYDTKIFQHRIEITDSEFTSIVFVNEGVLEDSAIAAEYIKRGLPVAKNMVLLCLLYEQQGFEIKTILKTQDKDCVRYIDNWSEIAAERDRLLDLLSSIK